MIWRSAAGSSGEKGSTYKVNAKEVRAKDVQLLFADAASGARSTALVSQGRVGAVVSAKPADRRKLLEEAAGITGLHSRRHEAELRLRGAETNLERLDDIMATLEAQMAGLKKQVRQATRYKNLSGHIRKAEATLFHIRWTAIEAELAAAREQLNQAETAVTSMTGGAGRASTEQAEIAAKLPELRNNEAEAAAKLQAPDHGPRVPGTRGTAPCRPAVLAGIAGSNRPAGTASANEPSRPMRRTRSRASARKTSV